MRSAKNNSHSPIWNLIEYCQFTQERLKTTEVLKFNAPARTLIWQEQSEVGRRKP